MPRKRSQQLTEAELRIMNCLWALGKGSVTAVSQALESDPPLAYNTVLTTLRILENKGYVRHEKDSRAFIYEPLVGREEASTGAVRHVLTRFFNNSPELLIANLLKEQKLKPRELERLKNLIAGQR